MGKKLKYRDVVKKPKVFKTPRHIKNKPKIRKNKNKHDKKSSKPRQEHPQIEKQDLQTHAVENILDSSESDEEIVDPLQQLRDTFKGENVFKFDNNVISESDSESDMDMEEHKQSVDDSKSADSDVDSDTEKLSDENVDSGDMEDLEDPFVKHLAYDLHPKLLESLENNPVPYDIHTAVWTKLGNVNFSVPNYDSEESGLNKLLNVEVKYATPPTVPKKINSKCLDNVFLKSKVVQNVSTANKSLVDDKNLLTAFQEEMFSIINNYQDLYFPSRTFNNAEEIRFVYCLHTVNHILKTRIKILHHNSKITDKEDAPEEYRDQGLVRPKVLMVLPFKDSAYKVITTIIDLLFPNDNGNVIKKNRFIEDYTGNELHFPKKNPKPNDYELTFAGNTDDNFKIGISLTKKSLKLYADFYSSDIIIASPLGLRTIIGAEGEAERDFDFLTSMELLILDQTEIFLMQNWDHLNHMFNHMHIKPKDLHGTDVSRVRQWSLNFWAKYYRQTLIFSSVTLPEINSIFNKKCCNYAGKAKIINSIESGSINQVLVQIPHIFHRFDTSGYADSVDARFNFFINKVLPQQKESLMKQTLVFIPSYFDYVRLRNHFKKEDISFIQICEYSKESKIARARDIFYHGEAHFILYTERYHFYNRIRIKGIRHLVFYQPPNIPHFYSEMCNLMQDANMNKKVGSMTNMTVTVIYSKYDLLQLSAIVGTERAGRMSQSDKKVHMIVTGAD